MLKSLSSIAVVLSVLLLPIKIKAQQSFKSTSYGYTLTYPDSWFVKSKTYTPNIDCKIVDGNGNSFIISIAPSNLSAEEFIPEIEKLSSSDLSAAFKGSNYQSLKILIRERRTLNGRQCYYIKTNGVLSTGETLISEMYLYNSGKNEYSINASYFEKSKITLEPVVKQIFSSFRF